MSSKVAQVTRNLRHQKWLEEIRSCNSRPKGMTISQWCELNNVNMHSYYSVFECLEHCYFSPLRNFYKSTGTYFLKILQSVSEALSLDSINLIT